MYKITTRSVIKNVVESWANTYEGKSYGHDKVEILENLKALNLDTCTKQDVDAIIGNSSWTTLKCDECRSEVDTVVQVGQEPDYESSTASLCVKCMRKALKLFKEG